MMHLRTVCVAAVLSSLCWLPIPVLAQTDQEAPESRQSGDRSMIFGLNLPERGRATRVVSAQWTRSSPASCCSTASRSTWRASACVRGSRTSTCAQRPSRCCAISWRTPAGSC